MQPMNISSNQSGAKKAAHSSQHNVRATNLTKEETAGPEFTYRWEIKPRIFLASNLAKSFICIRQRKHRIVFEKMVIEKFTVEPAYNEILC